MSLSDPISPSDEGVKEKAAHSFFVYIAIIGMAVLVCIAGILLGCNFQLEQRAKQAEHCCDHVNSLVVLSEDPEYQATRFKGQPDELMRLLERKHDETDAYNKEHGTNLKLQIIFVPLEPPSPEAE